MGVNLDIMLLVGGNGIPSYRRNVRMGDRNPGINGMNAI